MTKTCSHCGAFVNGTKCEYCGASFVDFDYQQQMIQNQIDELERKKKILEIKALIDYVSLLQHNEIEHEQQNKKFFKKWFGKKQ